MTDAEKMTKLLLELRMDAESLGKTLGKRGGDSIRNILKGKYKISANLARDIAEKHGISYVWLMTGEGPVFDDPNILDGPSAYKPSSSSGDDRDFIIRQLQEVIASQKDLIKSLLAQIEKLQNIG